MATKPIEVLGHQVVAGIRRFPHEVREHFRIKPAPFDYTVGDRPTKWNTTTAKELRLRNREFARSLVSRAERAVSPTTPIQEKAQEIARLKRELGRIRAASVLDIAKRASNAKTDLGTKNIGVLSAFELQDVKGSLASVSDSTRIDNVFGFLFKGVAIVGSPLLIANIISGAIPALNFLVGHGAGTAIVGGVLLGVTLPAVSAVVMLGASVAAFAALTFGMYHFLNRKGQIARLTRKAQRVAYEAQIAEPLRLIRERQRLLKHQPRQQAIPAPVAPRVAIPGVKQAPRPSRAPVALASVAVVLQPKIVTLRSVPQQAQNLFARAMQISGPRIRDAIQWLRQPQEATYGNEIPSNPRVPRHPSGAFPGSLIDAAVSRGIDRHPPEKPLVKHDQGIPMNIVSHINLERLTHRVSNLTQKTVKELTLTIEAKQRDIKTQVNALRFIEWILKRRISNGELSSTQVKKFLEFFGVGIRKRSLKIIQSSPLLYDYIGLEAIYHILEGKKTNRRSREIKRQLDADIIEARAMLFNAVEEHIKKVS